MGTIKTDHFQGGANIGEGTDDNLDDILRDVADDFAGIDSGVPQWTTGVSVSSDTVTLSDAGWVVAVEGTTGSSTGPKQIQSTASPGAGAVRVEYDGDGVATLTFNGSDAITECAVQIVKRSSGYSIKTTKG